MNRSNKGFFGIWRKTANKDYTSDMFPHNRRGVFLDVLKLHWGDFLIYGLIMFVICLPINVLSVNKVYAINDLTKAIELATGDERLALIIRLSDVKAVYALMQGACFVIIFLFLAGLARVIRQYAWEENVFFKTDFSSGLRSNWFQMLVLGLIFGVLYAFSVISYDWAQETTDMFQSLSMMIPICLFLFWAIPMALYAVSAISVYVNTFGNVLKIASAMVFAKPLAAIIVACSCSAAAVLMYMPNVAFMVIFRSILAILSPIALLGWMLSSFNVFDKHINATQFPELVGKGTVPENKEN